MLISFAVTAKLICIFEFAYAKNWFSYDAAQLLIRGKHKNNFKFFIGVQLNHDYINPSSFFHRPTKKLKLPCYNFFPLADSFGVLAIGRFYI